jgi:hypothetical protein
MQKIGDLMRANDILDDQVILQKGRFNKFGFEPAWSSFFDFYLNSKYFDPPLLELEDVTFFLFLRKNLNLRNPRWKMPTIRQMKTRFRIGSHKLDAMMRRLERAHLLQKQSGLREGGVNVGNNYILSDPIPTLEEFLVVADEGVFGPGLQVTFETCAQNENTGTQNENISVPEMRTSHVPEMRTDQQTSSFQQISENRLDPRWEKVLADIKMQLNAKTFDMFLGDTDLVSIEDGIAVISTERNYAKDWIENRLGAKIKRALKVEGVRCVVLAEA